MNKEMEKCSFGTFQNTIQFELNKIRYLNEQ